MTVGQANLIFDLGMNHGEDTLFYLQKGFKVVAVEANPVIHQKMSEEFATWIVSNKLVILNEGIWFEKGQISFYRNLDNSHWSSFDRNYGTRGETRYEELQIPCRTIDAMIDEFGTPYYLKVDIEGADKMVVKALASRSSAPTFVSVEEYGVNCIDDLKAVGYDRFAIVAQRDKSLAVPPTPAREGSYFFKTFDGHDTGLFGLELPNAWSTYEQARSNFVKSVRDEASQYVGPEHEWYDVHATFASALSRPARVAP